MIAYTWAPAERDSRSRLTLQEIDCNSSSLPASGSMPRKAWIEPNRDPCFYLGRFDIWGDNWLLLKLGNARLSLDQKVKQRLSSERSRWSVRRWSMPTLDYRGITMTANQWNPMQAVPGSGPEFDDQAHRLPSDSNIRVTFTFHAPGYKVVEGDYPDIRVVNTNLPS